MHGDRAIVALAARQHGLVTAADLRGAQLSRRTVARRLAEGRMRRFHRGVYLVGPLAGPWTREIATVLASGRTVVLSHRSAAGLVVEVDGFAFHSTRNAFERDRARDAALHIRGYRVIRLTWRQIADEPEAVVATVTAALHA